MAGAANPAQAERAGAADGAADAVDGAVHLQLPDGDADDAAAGQRRVEVGDLAAGGLGQGAGVDDAAHLRGVGDVPVAVNVVGGGFLDGELAAGIAAGVAVVWPEVELVGLDGRAEDVQQRAVVEVGAELRGAQHQTAVLVERAVADDAGEQARPGGRQRAAEQVERAVVDSDVVGVGQADAVEGELGAVIEHDGTELGVEAGVEVELAAGYVQLARAGQRAGDGAAVGNHQRAGLHVDAAVGHFDRGVERGTRSADGEQAAGLLVGAVEGGAVDGGERAVGGGSAGDAAVVGDGQRGAGARAQRVGARGHPGADADGHAGDADGHHAEVGGYAVRSPV